MRVQHRLAFFIILALVSLPSFGNSLEFAVNFMNEAMEEVAVEQVLPKCGESESSYTPAPLHDLFSKRGADCGSFIGEHGYGPHGKVLMEKFDELGECSPLLSPQSNLGEACPRWKLLNLEERKNFWVNAFAAIAWAESACKEKAKAAGTHDTAIGLLQLNASRSNRSWRGP